MVVRIGWVAFLAMATLGGVAPADGHEVFQDVLKKQYTLKSFSCTTCHPDSKDRKLRTPFADRIYQKLKPKNYSEKFSAAVAADEAARAKDPDSVGKGKGAVAEFDKMIAEDFGKTFKEVAQQSLTIDEMLKQGLFYGARLDTKKLEGAKEDDKDEDTDDDK